MGSAVAARAAARDPNREHNARQQPTGADQQNHHPGITAICSSEVNGEIAYQQNAQHNRNQVFDCDVKEPADPDERYSINMLA